MPKKSFPATAAALGPAESAAAAFAIAGDDAHLSIALVSLMTSRSKSWIHDAVKQGAFPAPVVRQPRCTRWRAGDVLGWLRAAAAPRADDGKVAA